MLGLGLIGGQMTLKGDSITRRDTLRLIGTAGLGLAAGEAFVCSKPNLDPKFKIAIVILDQVTTTLNELHVTEPLALVAKASKALADAQAFFQKADFTNSISALNEIIAPFGLFDQILSDIGVNVNTTVKAILITLRGALTVIAVILADQIASPAVVAAIKSASAANMVKVENVRRLADAKRINAEFLALRN